MPRGKRPTIDLTQRREWFKLHEEEGWTPPQIAKKFGYDVRTVRNYLNIESEEQQQKQATLMVYRDALQAHYHDLSTLAQTLDAQVKRGEPIALISEVNLLMVALHEHMKRTPLLTSIDKWNVHLQKMDDMKKSVQDRIKKEVGSDSPIRDLSPENYKQTIDSLATVLELQFERWVQGLRPFNLKEDFVIESVEGGVIPRYGAYRFGLMIQESAEVLKKHITDFEVRIKQWKEIMEMQNLLKEKGKLGNELSEELSYIIYRRVIPGKCRYCPW